MEVPYRLYAPSQWFSSDNPSEEEVLLTKNEILRQMADFVLTYGLINDALVQINDVTAQLIIFDQLMIWCLCPVLMDTVVTYYPTPPIPLPQPPQSSPQSPPPGPDHGDGYIPIVDSDNDDSENEENWIQPNPIVARVEVHVHPRDQDSPEMWILADDEFDLGFLSSDDSGLGSEGEHDRWNEFL